MACQTLVETLEAVDGLELYCEVHACPEPKGVILAVHDYGEHSGVYRNLFARLCQEGYSVYAADLRGHGKSPGERGFIARFEDYLEDLDLLLARIRDREAKQPIFVLGQGLGGLITSCYAFSRKPRIRGLILCGLLMDLPLNATERLMTRYAGFLFKNSKAAQDLRTHLLGPALAGELKEDELAFRGEIKANTVREILGACAWIEKSAQQLPFAILSIHAGQPRVERWLDALAAVDKAVLQYESADHHLLLHKERDQVVGDIIEWCEQHRSDPQTPDVDDEDEWDELANDAL